jgi:hypothetical protein
MMLYGTLEIVEDQTKLFLNELQIFEGFSNDEVSFGVMCAVRLV